ncbi:MAG: metal-dependent transcriptional regulator [Clostridia bacterium]|nr:metal-dependent transcriptional regulator [Clostridia bacterium]
MNSPESIEMYLETILLLRKRGARVKATDVAAELGFSRPSVSNAVKRMLSEGYIYLDKSGELALTEKGEERAKATYEKHCLLTDMLTAVGADKNLAEENACRIEHIISEELFTVLKAYWQSRDKK